MVLIFSRLRSTRIARPCSEVNWDSDILGVVAGNLNRANLGFNNFQIARTVWTLAEKEPPVGGAAWLESLARLHLAFERHRLNRPKLAGRDFVSASQTRGVD
jgi:hypothetical protein